MPFFNNMNPGHVFPSLCPGWKPKHSNRYICTKYCLTVSMCTCTISHCSAWDKNKTECLPVSMTYHAGRLGYNIFHSHLKVLLCTDVEKNIHKAVSITQASCRHSDTDLRRVKNRKDRCGHKKNAASIALKIKHLGSRKVHVNQKQVLYLHRCALHHMNISI